MPDDMAFDDKGRPLNISGVNIRKMIDAAFEDPEVELVAIIMRRGDDIFVPVLGPPSKESLAALESAVEGYRNAIRGM